MRDIRQDFENSPDLDGRSFHLASSATTLIYRMGPPLRLVRRRYPHADVHVTVAPYRKNRRRPAGPPIRSRPDLAALSITPLSTILPLYEEELLIIRPQPRTRVAGGSASAAALGAAALNGANSTQHPAWDNLPEHPRPHPRARIPRSRIFHQRNSARMRTAAKTPPRPSTRAIAECNRAGGGRVEVPAGVFLTAAIHLKSNVNLHLARGSTLLFDRRPARYLPLVYTRWEGVECMNYSAFIYADRAGKHRRNRRRHAGWQTRLRTLVALEGSNQLRLGEGPARHRTTARNLLFDMGDAEDTRRKAHLR